MSEGRYATANGIATFIPLQVGWLERGAVRGENQPVTRSVTIRKWISSMSPEIRNGSSTNSSFKAVAP